MERITSMILYTTRLLRSLSCCCCFRESTIRMDKPSKHGCSKHGSDIMLCYRVGVRALYDFIAAAADDLLQPLFCLLLHDCLHTHKPVAEGVL